VIRDVYSIKVIDSTKMFDFAIALCSSGGASDIGFDVYYSNNDEHYAGFS